MGINLKGQVIGNYSAKENGKGGVFLSNSDKHMLLIESNDNSLGRMSPVAINNSGQVLSIGHYLNGRGGYGPWLWSKTLGMHSLNIFDSEHVEGLALNDIGQIIGTYRSKEHNNKNRPFLWNNGDLEDMGTESKLAGQIENYGYHVLDIVLMSINNRSEIAGYFLSGKLNINSNKYFKTGYIPFLWNGEIHFPLPTPLKDPPCQMQLSNTGTVMFCASGKTYLWNLQYGLKKIENFEGKAFNSNDTVIGRSLIAVDPKENDGAFYEFVPAIWKKGKIVTIAQLLGLEDWIKSSSTYPDTYALEKVQAVIGINDKEQILCEGYIWDEIHPFILQPSRSE